MKKLDKRNCYYIPKKLIQATDVDFSKEIRLYVGRFCHYLDNTHSYLNDRRIPDLGVVHIDSKGRLYFPAKVREHLRINKSTTIDCYISEGKITFMTIV